MKIKTLIVTLLFAISMWAQAAAPAASDKPKDQAKAGCCKEGSSCCKDGCCQGKNAESCCKKGTSCCKDGASCGGQKDVAKADCCKAGTACSKSGTGCCANMAKDGDKGCCGGKMCKRHKSEKA